MRPITLPPRRYTVLDGVGVSFRCAPVAAFFYGFFDLAAAALTPVATLVAARFIDAAFEAFRLGSVTPELYRWLAVLAGLTAFGWLKRAMHNLADLRLVLALRAKYRTALTEKRTRLAYRHIENEETWDLVQRVAANPEGGRLKASYFHLVDLTAFAVKVAGLLWILGSAVWWGPIPVVVVSALALALGVRGGRAVYQAERDASAFDRRTDYLAGVLLGRDAAAERTLFAFASFLVGMWREAFERALSVRIQARLRWYANAYAGNLTNLAIWVFLMVILLGPLEAGAVSVGLFIALTQAFTRFDIVWGFMDTVNGLAADAEFYRDLTRFVQLEEAGVEPARGSATPRFESIELEDVRFAYPGTGRLVLDGFSVVLEPGRHYALVGANGCGKTTVTRLLTGLYRVDGGAIRINGRPVDDYPRDELLSFYSIVYQDFARYGVSLRDNVFLGRPDPVDADAAWSRVATLAGLDEVAARLPNGPDTPLGKHVPGGADISGGEWQRVAMARALAKPAPLRILDEPTASLDPVAESELYARFDRLTEGSTTLLITHRLGATRMADVVLVLDSGRIVESGSHRELMNADGLYRRMYESQRYWYDA